MKKYKLRLYITGNTPRSESAISKIKDICKNELLDEYEINIIDVLEQPELAEQDKILATPTLIKELPPPLRRIIGDLTDSEKVIVGLDLQKKNK